MWKFKQNSLGGCCPVLVLSPTIVSMSARQIQVCRFIWCVGCSQVVITHAPFPNRWSQFCYSRKEATIRRFCKLVYFFWNRILFLWSFLRKALFLLHSCAQKSYSRKEATATICRFSKLVYLFWTRALFFLDFCAGAFLGWTLVWGLFVNESCSGKPYGIVNSCRIAGLLRVFWKREYLLKNSSLYWVSFGTQINSINFCWALLQKSC